MALRTRPELGDITAAQARLEGIARVTPIYRSETLSRVVGREVHLKAENLQRTGSFKIRGAFNRIVQLGPEERAGGVVTASAGNHGQAVAWAAREVGCRATVFMPEDAPMAKVDATTAYGATVELTPGGFEASLDAASAFVAETGATYVHPYEDREVIAGQGTIGLELAEQIPEAETVIVPVGGGGLCSGIATALAARRPGTRVVGVRAAGTAPGGAGFTIADGIAVKQPGEIATAILDELLDDLVVVGDEEISEAVVLLAERVKLVVEGAGAVGVAALLSGRVRSDGPCAVLLSGGNIDSTLLISVMRRGLAVSGRYLVVRTRVPDRPGQLARLLTLLGAERVNVLGVGHLRESGEVPVGETAIELTLLTRNAEHRESLLALMREWGYPVERLG